MRAGPLFVRGASNWLYMSPVRRPLSWHLRRGRQYVPRLGDRCRGVPGVGRKCEEQPLVGREMIEDRGQKSRLSGRRPQTIPPKARQSQESVKPQRIRGQKV